VSGHKNRIETVKARKQMNHITIGPEAPSNVKPSPRNLIAPSDDLKSAQMIIAPTPALGIPMVTGRCSKYSLVHILYVPHSHVAMKQTHQRMVAPINVHATSSLTTVTK